MKIYVASIFLAIALVSVFFGHAEAQGQGRQGRDCDSRYAVYYPLTDMCYCLNKKNYDWYQARAFCQAGGGDLAVIVDATLNALLVGLANRWCPPYWDVWFGLYGRDDQGEFHWVDGSPFNPPATYQNFPDELPTGLGECICMADSDIVPIPGQWFQFSCDYEQPFFCQSQAPTSICCDPHFMVHVQGMDDPVCFDYYGDDKDVLQLVYSPEDGMVVNGEIFTNGHTKRSWFGALSLIVPGCEITASNEGVTIQGKMNEWETIGQQHCGSTQVTFSIDADSSTRAAHLNIFVRPGVQFVFSRDHKEYNFGDIIYMNFDMGEQYGLDETTNGLLGHFMGMKVNLGEESVVNTTHKAILSFPDEPWRDSVTAESVGRKILYTHKHIRCWNVDNEGEGLVRGTARDYLVPDLLTNKMAQDFKHIP